MFRALELDIGMNYDKKPIIVIYDESQEQEIQKILANNRYKHLSGVEPKTL